MYTDIFQETKYLIKLKKWSVLFGEQEDFKLIFTDDKEQINEKKYKNTFRYLKRNQNIILNVLKEYCLKEYNYFREFLIKDCRKRYLNELLQRLPKLENREDVSRFFRLTKIQIIPSEKSGEEYTIFDITIFLSEERDYENVLFSIILLKNKFIAAIDTFYKMLLLKEIIRKDENCETLDYMTSMHMGYHSRFFPTESSWDTIDFSTLIFRGKSTMGKFKELIPYTSCLGLLETIERNSDCGLPPGSKIIGCLGIDGIFFIANSIGVKKEEAPIFVVSPMNFDCYIAPVSRNLLEFISLGVSCRNFGLLESISTSDKEDIEKYRLEEDHDPNIKELINIIQKQFPIIPIEDPYNYVKKSQLDKVLIDE